jgi:integrase
MKASNKLTELTVRQAKPPGKVRKLSDGGGMYLLLHPNGSKYWRLDYRLSGKQQTLALGVWPNVSLKEAREIRDEAKQLIKQKINPIDFRRQKETMQREIEDEKERNEEIQSNTFSKVAYEWMNRQSSRWTEKHLFDVRSAFERHIFPDFGDKPIVETGVRDVLDTLRKLESENKYDAAYRARQRCDAVFRFGIVSGVCERNPAADLKDVLTPPKKNSQTALKPSELPEFLHKLQEYDLHRLTKLAMYFILYTFVRTSELRFAEWDEMDLESAKPTWKIPVKRMKMRRQHLVPLVHQTLDILHQVEEISGCEKLVFPQQKNPQRPMSENTLLYALYRMGYHSRATVHGFRATASTILNESGQWHPDAIERQLAHVEGNKVRAAYNRAEYLDERREMMQWWADKLDSFKLSST